MGYPISPEDLLVDENGEPRRVDHAFSWSYPLAAHGMLQSVIRNAVAGDPYRIDTLFLFMANMGWNSAMDTAQTRKLLCERDANGLLRVAPLSQQASGSTFALARANALLTIPAEEHVLRAGSTVWVYLYGDLGLGV